MRTPFATCVLVALALQTAMVVRAEPTGSATSPPTPAKIAPVTQPVVRGGELTTLEQKLLGIWRGGPCDGQYTFNPDGTFELTNFTPGGNTLTGTWSVRWDALPPTLVLTCKTSDIGKGVSARPDNFLGKALNLQLLELNRDTFVCRWPDNKEAIRYERKWPE